MLRYIARRLIQGVLTLFIVSFITFGMMHVGPGDPIEAFIGERPLTTEQLDLLTARWGLDRPWYEQYMTWLGNMARGDFGTSIMRPGQSIGEMILDAAPYTIKLNIYTFILSGIIAIPLGIMAGVRRYSKLDYGSMIGSTLGICIPNFWLGLMLILLFAVYFDLLPASGLRTWSGWILPVVVLATAETALLARLMRSSTIEVLNQDYVTTARAKGLTEYVVIIRHAVRNALLPVVTVLGYRIAFLLSGTIVVEQVFAIPGLGRLFLSSALRHDYQVVQAIVLLFAVLVIVANIVTDLVYAYVDPRIRLR
jgi:peptide/nickel transport system permease protein